MKITDESEQKTILLVDDDPQIPALLKVVLTERGFHVVVAQNGFAGLHAVMNLKPHLILLDLNMPGMDGLTLLNSIRDFEKVSPLANRPKILVVSAKHEKEKVLAAKELKVDGFIAKPFELKELFKRIAQLLGTGI